MKRSLPSMSGIDNASATEIPPRNPPQVKMRVNGNHLSFGCLTIENNPPTERNLATRLTIIPTAEISINAISNSSIWATKPISTNNTALELHLPSPKIAQ